MAAKNPPLRAVTEDEKPPAPKQPARVTVTKAIDLTERDLLVSLRANMAREIDAGVPAHALAGMTKQLLELDKSIRAIDLRAAEEASDGDGNQGQAEDTGDEAFDSQAI